MSQHGKEDATKLRRLQIGGYWTDYQQGTQFEGQSEVKCFHCGQIMHGVFHLWSCKQLEKHRREADEELNDAALDLLPRHLLLGIPDHRQVSLSGNLVPIAVQGPGARWDLDCILHTGVSINEETRAAYAATCAEEGELDTQQIAYKFLSYLGTSPKPRIQKCDESPPSLPNVFTDGSYLHPGRCPAHATFGSWQPERTQDEVTEEEQDFCRVIARCDGKPSPGVSMAGSIPGVFSSSTRAELAGVIAALAKPGSIHLALDNRSVVDGINALTSGGNRSRRPWSLRSDGDQWAIAEEAIDIKGARSILATWTKGHATWQHIIESTCTSRNAIGNGYADAAADAGHKAAARHSEQLVLDNIAAPQAAYVKFIARMQRYALAVISADKREREEHNFVPAGKAAPIQWIAIAQAPPSRPDFTVGSCLDMLSLPRSLEGSLAEESVFWQRTLWTQQGQPTTWLELYALFRFWGGTQVRPMTCMIFNLPSNNASNSLLKTARPILS